MIARIITVGLAEGGDAREPAGRAVASALSAEGVIVYSLAMVDED